MSLGKPTAIQAKYIFQNNDPFGSTKKTVEKQVIKEFPELEPLIEAESLAELKLKNSISWYFGKTIKLDMSSIYRFEHKLAPCKTGRKSGQAC